MNRLILDHLRRWRWVLAMPGLIAFGLGWFLATPDRYAGPIPGKAGSFLISFFKTYSYMSVPSAMLLTMVSSALLLQFDVQRGLVRAIAPLPLTGRQMGRGWWLATTGIPAGALVALMFAGAGAFVTFHSSHKFQFQRLMTLGIYVLILQGVAFTIYFPMGRQLRGKGTWRVHIVNLLVSASVIWIYFGFLLSLGAPENPVKFAVFLAVGAIVTAVGWRRADRFNLGRGPFDSKGIPMSGFPSPVSPRFARKVTPRLHSLESGRPDAARCGGIPLLLGTMFARTFSVSAAMLLLMMLIWRIQGTVNSWQQAVEMVGNLGNIFWIISFLFYVPILSHLRFLRTLPLSSSYLAAVLLATAILPSLAMGALVGLVAWLSLGSAAAVEIVKNYALVAAPASLCFACAAGFGMGMPVYGLVLVLGIGFQLLQTRIDSFSTAVAVVISCLLLSFLLVRNAAPKSGAPARWPS